MGFSSHSKNFKFFFVNGSFGFLGLIQTINCVMGNYPSESMLDDTSPVPEALIYQGDIILPSLARNALTTVVPWDNGIVPYLFDPQTDRRFQEEVRFAMENINRLTKGCIKFVPRTNQRDYLVITSYANKCFAAYGRYVGLGPHKVFLGPMCREQRTILHELVHTLGFVHEQSRTDRDRYVTILYPNIINGIRSQFSIDHNTITYGVPYDYESIVHYSQYEFSMNGGPTIITKNRRYQNIIGNVQTLSEKDILKIQRKYKCHDNQTPFQNQMNFGK